MAQGDRGGFSILWEDAHEKRTFVVTGAFGGLTPDGSLVVAHLYTDLPPPPSIQTHEIGAGGEVNLGTGDSIRRADIVREVQATAILSAGAARSLGNWLIEKADFLEAQDK